MQEWFQNLFAATLGLGDLGKPGCRDNGEALGEYRTGELAGAIKALVVLLYTWFSMLSSGLMILEVNTHYLQERGQRDRHR